MDEQRIDHQGQGVMRRFALLGKLTAAATAMMLPLVMLVFPDFGFGYQLAIAFELAGITVMGFALLCGGWVNLRQWWQAQTAQATKRPSQSGHASLKTDQA